MARVAFTRLGWLSWLSWLNWLRWAALAMLAALRPLGPMSAHADLPAPESRQVEPQQLGHGTLDAEPVGWQPIAAEPTQGEPSDGQAVRWERLHWAGRGEALTAVAFDPATGRLAVGDAKGVSLWRPAVSGVSGASGAPGREAGWIGGGRPAQRIARSEGVGDLAFGADGALWIAAQDGLWRFIESTPGAPPTATATTGSASEPDLIAHTDPIAHAGSTGSGSTGSGSLQRLEERSPAPGEAARRAHRLALLGDFVAVATESGVYVSRGGSAWLRIDGLGSAVSALALRSLPPGAEGTRAGVDAIELWMAGAGGPWLAVVAADERGVGTGVALRSLHFEAIPGAPTGVMPVDLRVDFGGAAVALLYPGALALRRPGSDPGWSVWRPVLPVGAVARRIVAASGRLWLATDRGLLESTDARTGWRRSTAPAARAPLSALASAGVSLFAAGEGGLLRGRVASRFEHAGERASEPFGPGEPGVDRASHGDLAERSRGASRAASEAGAPEAQFASDTQHRRGEPPVRAVQEMALRYLALDGPKIRSLREQAARRGWLPRLDLRLGYGEQRDRSRDYDQSFVSGDTRNLVDRDHGHSRDWDAGISLSWDLRNGIFDPDQIDAAREERQWIALRDDVLDEVGQLYFERRRTLLEIARLESGDEAATGAAAAAREVARLRLRAAELGAGLDGWTGGAFTHALASVAPAPSGSSPPPGFDPLARFDAFDRFRRFDRFAPARPER